MWKTQLEIKAVSKDYGVSQISLPKVLLHSLTLSFPKQRNEKKTTKHQFAHSKNNQPAKEKPKLALQALKPQPQNIFSIKFLAEQ